MRAPFRLALAAVPAGFKFMFVCIAALHSIRAKQRLSPVLLEGWEWGWVSNKYVCFPRSMSSYSDVAATPTGPHGAMSARERLPVADAVPAASAPHDRAAGAPQACGRPLSRVVFPSMQPVSF